MPSKRKLKDDIVTLSYRVKELEERLCPCQSHEWKKVETEFEYIYDEFVTVHTHQCTRCGKRKTSWTP